jgi:hypothetical protein
MSREKNLERFLREDFRQNLNEGWYTVKPHPEGEGRHIVTTINNGKNPYNHKIGDVVSKGQHFERQYAQDGGAYSSAPKPETKKEDLNERKSSDPKGISYAITRDSHAAYPEWGPANHQGDPAKDFGTAATRSSAVAAIKAYREIRKKHGSVDMNNPEHVEHISKNIHGSPSDYGGQSRGWSKAAIELGEPHQTAEKKAKRGTLTGPYGGLSEPEKEKDRVIARTVAKHLGK